MSQDFSIHVRTMTGLEDVLADELSSIGAREIQPKSRLVVCSGDLRMLYKANILCRTAIRVLRPLASFAAPSEQAFYDGIREIDWYRWLSATGTLAVNAHAHSSFTTHSLYLAQLAKDAVADQFRDKTGKRPSVDLENPDLRIVVGLFQNNAQIYLDASGESLHKRGYRGRAGAAPLNETLAAGILKLSGWDGSTPLLDPMCGSATFGIEAGLMLRNIAPGLLREQYGFQKWPDYDRGLFDGLIAEAKNAVRRDATAPILGFEIDPGVAEIARQNIDMAGLTGLVQVETGDFFKHKAPAVPAGTIVINPPYDERLRVENVADLWRQIGSRLVQAYEGWTAYVLCGNPDGAEAIGIHDDGYVELYNGAIECRLFKYDLKAGSQLATVKPPEDNPKWREKAEVFANRLRKTLKHYSKWAKREGITCWRVYDRDIPELPFIIDIYGDRLHFAEIPRNHDHTEVEHLSYMQLMVKTASAVLGIPPEKTYFKKRTSQGAPAEATGEFFEVTEGGHRFLVNLADHTEVGLFLDQRDTRARIRKEAAEKDFLNLYGYTGSLTVYAASGGAKSTTTVDSSRNYLEWAENNLRLNGLSGAQHQLVRSDVIDFLEHAKTSYDLCVVDPPARSVNRSTADVFDVQADHVRLLRLVLARMRPGGKVYFSTNYRSFDLDDASLKYGQELNVKEITDRNTPTDFERRPGHRTWLINKENHGN